MSTVALFVSMALVATVIFVQQRVIPEQAEIIVRSSAEKLGLCAVPVLIVLACCGWAKVSRAELPAWRNGLGLSSMVILSVVWLLYSGLLVLASAWPNLTRFFNLDWMATLLDFTLAAGVLAMALRGAPRIQGIAASLCMWACLQAGIFF